MSKYKIKSSKSIAKRFRITSSGKFLRHKACRSHLLQKKSSKHKQALRKVESVKSADYAMLKSKVLI